MAAAARSRLERLVVWDGVFSRLMDAWTGGVFLAGLGLLVGADTFTLGLLAALPFLAQVAQLPAVHLLLRAPDRRRIVVAAALCGRLLLVAIAVLVAAGRLDPPLLVGILAAMAVLSVVSAAAWNTWMRSVLDPQRLGRFFAHRLQVMTAVSAVALVSAGWFLDRWTERGLAEEGYGLLYGAGAAAGMVSVVILARTPSPPATPGPRRGALALMADVLKDPNNTPTILGLSLVAAAMAVALPFTAVYLLRSVGYGFLVITLLALASQVAYMTGLRAWGHLSDRHGNRPVIQIATGLMVVVLLAWAVSWPRGPALLAFLAALHVASGLALGGLDLTTSNLMLKTAPPENAPAYLAGLSLARALVAGLATLGAGLLWSVVGTGVIARVGALDLRGFHVLALLSALIAAVALVALRRVQETGVSPVPEVVRTMRREVQTVSSVAGMRPLVHAASYFAEVLHVRPSTRRAGRRGRRRSGAAGAGAAGTGPAGGAGPPP